MLEALRHWWDRRAHTARRAEAEARLAATELPRVILVMCHGNINRSPYAEHRLRALLAAASLSDVVVHSSGVIGPGRRASEPARLAAAARGVELGAHVSSTLSPSMVMNADLVLVMGPSQVDALRGRVRVPRARVFCLGDFDPEPIESREIHDPVRQEMAVFEQSFDRIDRCLAVVVALLRGRR